MCAAVQAELGALLDDELAEEMASEVRRHAMRCDACGRALRETQALRDRIRRVRTPARAPESLRERVRRELSQPSRRERGG